MDSTNGMRPLLDESPAVEITSKIMIVGILVLFIVVVFVFLFHLYARWFWWRVQDIPIRARHVQNPRRRRFAFAAGQDPSGAAAGKGLDASVLMSLGVVILNPEEFKDGLECSVCLSEVEQGEKARLLPKCKHGFHVECIDMWFQSHSTCPLCRNLVEATTNSLEETSTSSSSSSSSSLIIDIPGHMTDDLSSSSEEVKSPMVTRLRSLKRLLSKGKRVGPSSSACVEAGQVEGKEPQLMS